MNKEVEIKNSDQVTKEMIDREKRKYGIFLNIKEELKNEWIKKNGSMKRALTDAEWESEKREYEEFGEKLEDSKRDNFEKFTDEALNFLDDLNNDPNALHNLTYKTLIERYPEFKDDSQINYRLLSQYDDENFPLVDEGDSSEKNITEETQINSSETRVEKRATKKENANIPKSKNLLETLKDIKSGDERLKFINKFQGHRTHVIIGGKKQYLKIKDGQLIDFNKDSEVIFEFYDENGQPILGKNGQPKEKAKKISKIEYLDWKAVDSRGNLELIDGQGKKFESKLEKPRQDTNDEKIKREQLNQELFDSFYDCWNFCSAAQEYFTKNNNKVGESYFRDIVDKLKKYWDFNQHKIDSRQIELFRLKEDIDTLKKKLLEYQGKKEVLEKTSHNSQEVNSQEIVKQKIKGEFLNESYQKAQELYLEGLTEEEKKKIKGIEGAKFSDYLNELGQKLDLDRDRICDMMAHGVKINQMRERGIIQRTLDSVKKGGIWASGGAVTGGILTGSIFGPLGAIFGVPLGASYGIYRGVDEFAKEKITIPVVNGQPLIFDSLEDFNDWAEDFNIQIKKRQEYINQKKEEKTQETRAKMTNQTTTKQVEKKEAESNQNEAIVINQASNIEPENNSQDIVLEDPKTTNEPLVPEEITLVERTEEEKLERLRTETRNRILKFILLNLDPIKDQEAIRDRVDELNKNIKNENSDTKLIYQDLQTIRDNTRYISTADVILDIMSGELLVTPEMFDSKEIKKLKNEIIDLMYEKYQAEIHGKKSKEISSSTKFYQNNLNDLTWERDVDVLHDLHNTLQNE